MFFENFRREDQDESIQNDSSVSTEDATIRAADHPPQEELNDQQLLLRMQQADELPEEPKSYIEDINGPN